MPPPSLRGSVTILGRRVPTAIALLIGLTLAASVVGAIGLRSGVPLVEAGLFMPASLRAGQVWRLVTWVLFELQPISLLFGCLALFWFGADLVRAWGPGRFLGVYFGFAAATAGATVLVAIAWPELRNLPLLGPWAVIDALIIAWATLFPHQDILVYFVLPLRGRQLVQATVGLTVLFALLSGVALFVPHFVAMGLMFLWLRWGGELWLRMRLALLPRRLWRPPSHLRPVDKRPPEKSRDEPPRWLH